MRLAVGERFQRRLNELGSPTSPTSESSMHPLPQPLARHFASTGVAMSQSVGLLNHPGTQLEMPNAYTFATAPIATFPASTTWINHDRLPEQKELERTDLAFREQVISDAQLFRTVHVNLLVLLLASPVLFLFIFAITPLISGIMVVGGAATLTLLLLVMDVIRAKLTRDRILRAFALPLIATVIAGIAALAASSRLSIAAFASLVAIVAVWRLGGAPFQFFAEWIWTYPRLKPETRDTREGLKSKPDLALLAALLLFSLFVPLVSNATACVGVASAATFVFFRNGRDVRHVRLALEILARYLCYGMASSGAPGIWRPALSIGARRVRARVPIALIISALGVSLCGYYPVDALRPWTEFIKSSRAIDSQTEDIGLAPGEYREWSSFAARPAEWVAPSVVVTAENPNYIWFYALQLLAALCIPCLVTLAVFRKPLQECLDLRARVEGGTDSAETEFPGLDVDDRAELQWYWDRLAGSTQSYVEPFGRTVYEAEHFIVGVDSHLQMPVLFSSTIWAEHIYIVGGSGTGKTSLALMPLLIQIARGPAPRSGLAPKRSPMLILDLKGDMALFHTARLEAERRRKELGIDDSTPEGRADPRCAFRFFTPEQGRTTHYFNPFLSFSTSSLSIIQVCQLMLESLSLWHGEGYGRSHFSRLARMILLKALSGRTPPKSFEELHEVIVQMTGRSISEPLELLSVVEALTQYEALATSKRIDDPASAIHMPSVLEHNQIVYFFLPAAIESVSVREIGKLALYSLLAAAIDRKRSGKEMRDCAVFIDEFQRITGQGFTVILEQAREFRIGLILCNQSINDLVTPDSDLRPAVLTNTRYRQYFSIADYATASELSRMSGEHARFERSWSTSYSANGTTYGESVSPTVTARLSISDILRASDHPLDSIIVVPRGDGLTQFGGLAFTVRTVWPITREEYDRRRHLPWPEMDQYAKAGMVIASKGPRQVEKERTERMAADLSQAVAEQLAKFMKPEGSA